MKKALLLVMGLVLVCGPALAGNIDISANAGMYTAPGGIGTSTMYGIAATQPLTENISVRAMIESTTYTVAGQSTTYMPISLDVIYGQTLPGGIRPYAGLGLSYNSYSVSGGSSSSTTGAQALAGVSYALGPVNAGLEFRYMIPDLGNTGTTATAFNGFVTGSVAQSFSF